MRRGETTLSTTVVDDFCGVAEGRRAARRSRAALRTIRSIWTTTIISPSVATIHSVASTTPRSNQFSPAPFPSRNRKGTGPSATSRISNSTKKTAAAQNSAPRLTACIAEFSGFASAGATVDDAKSTTCERTRFRSCPSSSLDGQGRPLGRRDLQHDDGAVDDALERDLRGDPNVAAPSPRRSGQSPRNLHAAAAAPPRPVPAESPRRRRGGSGPRTDRAEREPS